MRAFWVDDVARRVPPICLQDSNAFRAAYCYIEATDIVLRKYESSLRTLFTVFAYGTGAIGDELLSTKLMDFGEYMSLITRLNLTLISQDVVQILP